MAERDAAFVGSIPENYDRYLGPLFFREYAEAMAVRLQPVPGMRVLETACGTGIVTERLVARLAGQGGLVATDLNAPMSPTLPRSCPAPRASSGRKPTRRICPSKTGRSTPVVCQFGLMFFPDKPRAWAREPFAC